MSVDTQRHNKSNIYLNKSFNIVVVKDIRATSSCLSIRLKTLLLHSLQLRRKSLDLGKPHESAERVASVYGYSLHCAVSSFNL